MPSQFLKVARERRKPDGAQRTIYINLDAILYVDDYGVDGEPITVYCREREKYYLVGPEADALIQALEQRACRIARGPLDDGWLLSG